MIQRQMKPAFFQKTGFGSRIMPLNPRPPDNTRPECPHPCFGREHGRNKGEFNSLDCRLGLILPMSLTVGAGAKQRFPGTAPGGAPKLAVIWKCQTDA